jgi:hypothetical protein
MREQISDNTTTTNNNNNTTTTTTTNNNKGGESPGAHRVVFIHSAQSPL